MDNCSEHALWPQKACAYGGSCNSNTTYCVCEPGFSDVGDFQLRPGRHCNIPVKLVECIWWIAFGLDIIILLFRIYSLSAEIVYGAKARRRKKRPWYKVTMIRYHSLGLVCDINQLIYTGIKSMSPFTLLIGENWIPTLWAGMVPLTWWVYGFFAFYNVGMLSVKLLSKSNPHIEHRFNNSYRDFARRTFLSLLLYGPLPCAGLYIMGPEYDTFWGSIRCFGFVISLFFIHRGKQMLVLLEEALTEAIFTTKEVQQHMQSDAFFSRLQTLKQKTIKGQELVDSTCIQESIFFSLIGAWPFLRSFQPILIATEPLFGALASVICEYLIYNPNRYSRKVYSVKTAKTLQDLRSKTTNSLQHSIKSMSSSEAHSNPSTAVT